MTLLKILLSALLGMVFVMFVFAIGPEIESRLFPVYSKFKLVSATHLADGSTEAVFQFTKFRNCDPQGYAFFNGELGKAFYQVVVQVRGGPDVRVRPLGTQLSYPYILRDVSPQDLVNTVFAEIYSHCHSLWPTRTKVYP